MMPMKITIEEFTEQSHALHLMKKMEGMIASWDKASKDQVTDNITKTRFEYLHDMVAERYGSNGHLSWQLMMLSIATHQYFNQQMSEAEFQYIRGQFKIAFEAFWSITQPSQGSS